jgi:hypothetical protein
LFGILQAYLIVVVQKAACAGLTLLKAGKCFYCYLMYHLTALVSLERQAEVILNFGPESEFIFISCGFFVSSS